MAEILKSRIFKCDNCGSLLSYDPISGKLKCSHCASLFEIENIYSARELVYTSTSEVAFVPWNETKSFKCRSCGAEFVIDEYQTATKCPFCSASNVAYIDDVPGLKPNAILPFKINEVQAEQYFKQWLKKKYMVPFGFKKKLSKMHMNGMYLPVFTFDTSTYSTYHIRYGVTHVRTQRIGGKTVTKTYTTWHTDSGYISKDFNDIQIEASTHLDQSDLEGMRCFDTPNAYAYRNEFIAGFAAERYSSGLDDSFEQAKEIASNSIRREILSRYSYDVLDYCNVNTDFSNVTYKYILVPVWVMEYKYKKKVYKCFVNGRDGDTYGRTPTSASKCIMIALVAIGVVLLLYYLTR